VSIADAVRARDLEARVKALEARVAELEKGGGEVAENSQGMRLVMGQLNSLRAKIDRLVPPGPPGSVNDAA
jgi:hypothetical protein